MKKTPPALYLVLAILAVVVFALGSIAYVVQETTHVTLNDRAAIAGIIALGTVSVILILAGLNRKGRVDLTAREIHVELDATPTATERALPVQEDNPDP